MSYKILILCIFALLFLFILFRGDRSLKARKSLDEQMADIYGEIPEVFDDVAYQGGFPPMPKPARLHVGVAQSGLVLYDKSGKNGEIPYDKIKKVDRFITNRKRKYKFGLMAYGPIALVLNRPSYSHFFTADYMDVNDEKNILVIVTKTKEMSENLYRLVKPHVQGRKKK